VFTIEVVSRVDDAVAAADQSTDLHTSSSIMPCSKALTAHTCRNHSLCRRLSFACLQSAVQQVLKMDIHIVWDRRQLLYATALAEYYPWVNSRALSQIYDDVWGFLSPDQPAVQSPSAAVLLYAENFP